MLGTGPGLRGLLGPPGGLGLLGLTFELVDPGTELFGAGLGLCFTVGLVLIDAHGLASLLQSSESGFVGFALLAGGFMITCGSLAAGTALMMIPRGDDDDYDDGDRQELELQPIPVRVRRR